MCMQVLTYRYYKFEKYYITNITSSEVAYKWFIQNITSQILQVQEWHANGSYKYKASEAIVYIVWTSLVSYKINTPTLEDRKYIFTLEA